MILWKEIDVTTTVRIELKDVTAQVSATLTKSDVKNGTCYVYVPHTTAGVTINENADPDVVGDLLATLEKLVPVQGDYRHVEGNSDAHMKASMMGFSQIIPIMEGKLALGTWQGIYFCEFDGPRKRKMLIGITG